jgi:hypothetical protein
MGGPTFANEVRVNRMLLHYLPPVPFAPLLGCAGGAAVFAAVPGAPLGPKFPTSASFDLAGLVSVAARMEGYRPRRRWFRRLDVPRRLGRHVALGLLSGADAALIAGVPLRFAFAHGDITARNVMRSSSGSLVLIDWEWAGSYPLGYDLAFLWMTLIDVPAGRSAVRAAVPPWLAQSFLASAILVTLLHLHMWTETGRTYEFRPAHEETLRSLLAELRAGGQPPSPAVAGN